MLSGQNLKKYFGGTKTKFWFQTVKQTKNLPKLVKIRIIKFFHILVVIVVNKGTVNA